MKAWNLIRVKSRTLSHAQLREAGRSENGGAGSIGSDRSRQLPDLSRHKRVVTYTGELYNGSR